MGPRSPLCVAVGLRNADGPGPDAYDSSDNKALGIHYPVGAASRGLARGAGDPGGQLGAAVILG